MRRLFILLGFVLIISVFFGYFSYFTLENGFKEQNYELKIDVPTTSYAKLNDYINNKVNFYVSMFEDSFNTQSDEMSNFYSLIIYYKEYVYEDFLSYVFWVESFVGGVHPDHDIWTTVYDKNNDMIIDINYLVKLDEGILEKFSLFSRDSLVYNKKIVDTAMMMEGTLPRLENFSRFVFTKDGVLLYFPRYQVAPYSSGEFTVSIPYEKLGLSSLFS